MDTCSVRFNHQGARHSHVVRFVYVRPVTRWFGCGRCTPAESARIVCGNYRLMVVLN